MAILLCLFTNENFNFQSAFCRFIPRCIAFTGKSSEKLRVPGVLILAILFNYSCFFFFVLCVFFCETGKDLSRFL